MSTSWHDDISDTIAKSQLAADGLVDREARQRAHIGCAHPKDPPVPFWHLLMLEKWYRHEAHGAAEGSRS